MVDHHPANLNSLPKLAALLAIQYIIVCTYMKLRMYVYYIYYMMGGAKLNSH